MASIMSSYHTHLKELEDQLRSVTTENVDLHIQIKQVRRHGSPEKQALVPVGQGHGQAIIERMKDVDEGGVGVGVGVGVGIGGGGEKSVGQGARASNNPNNNEDEDSYTDDGVRLSKEEYAMLAKEIKLLKTRQMKTSAALQSTKEELEKEKEKSKESERYVREREKGRDTTVGTVGNTVLSIQPEPPLHSSLTGQGEEPAPVHALETSARTESTSSVARIMEAESAVMDLTVKNRALCEELEAYQGYES